MSENLFCEGNQITPAYKDGWYRSFKGYPKVNKEVWDMITKFKKSPRKLLLFFIEYVTDDEEYASFLTRDLLNGVWNG
jgi:hypothetical protein